MKKLLSVVVLVCLFCSFRGGEKTWVALGDSITYLNDHADETSNRVKLGYMTRVTKELPDLHYINQGYNGWTASGIAEVIDSLSLQKADIYTVLLGTNDWWHGGPLGSFDDYLKNTGYKTVFGAFRIIINKFRQLNPDAKIILMTPLQRVDFVNLGNMRNNAWGSYKEKNGQSLSQFADAIRKIGEYEHLTVVDLYNKSGMTLEKLVKYKRLKDPKTGQYKNYPYPASINIPFNPDTDEYPYPVEAMDYTYDGLHPSDKGNAVIAKMLVKALKK